MGQSNSRSLDGEPLTSGVTLAPELEADIMRDFQSKLLQDEWNKFGTQIVSRRNERLQRLQAAVQSNQAQRAEWSHWHTQRLAQLDSTIDQLSATIADQTVAIDYDASQLLTKYADWTTTSRRESDDHHPDKESKPLPCLGQRAHWIDCQKKYASDSRPCNFYVAALEECVTQTIAGQSQRLASKEL